MFPHSLTWVKWPSFLLPQGICSLLWSYHVTLKAFIPWYYSCNFSASFKLYQHKKLYPPTLTAAAAKSLQSCPTLCDPIDGSPPGSPVPRILQARTLEWVAISFSNAWKWKVKVKSLSCVRLLATPWTAAYQAPPSTGFSRQEYWSGLPLPSPPTLTSYHKLWIFNWQYSKCFLSIYKNSEE